MPTRIVACLMVMSLAPLPAVSEEAPQPPPAPKWYDTFELHGLVDAYYSANLDQAQGTPNALRAFDLTNGFQLSYAKLIAQLTPPKPFSAGFRADVGFGQTASVLRFKSTPSSGDVVVQQAFVSYALPGGLVLDGGKFVTNAGAEVIEAKDDWLYSRSLLFAFAIPFTHTGVRATIPVPGVAGLSVMATVFNGWDNPPKQVGPQKTGHLAFLYSGPSSTTLTLNAFYGRNPSENDERLLLDGVAARSFGPLSLNVNGDYGRLGGASYWGISAMARLALARDRLRVGVRGEYLDDSDGLQVAPPVGNRYWEGTLGLSVPLGRNTELRLEGRHDRARRGDLTPGHRYQTTLQAAALAWF
ncbi:outer membrane beta-barrel protein [Anaeromyxobacter oryzisoli]|uniref:outer membrane beta-barrel protein n=1 Tax=Anaeromyxobacter oryzisoli TaxID=2925408 RepID=UPI001F560D08|nr:outer membrane beta-barrel protein [Anaeromyxobacter sp. SG63]